MSFGNCVADEENVSTDRSHAYQVRRSDFDALLLKNAAANGVEAREGHTVLDLLSEDERITGVRFRDEAGRDRMATARFVADASGHQSGVAARIGERIASKFYRHIGVYGYYEHGGRLPGGKIARR